MCQHFSLLGEYYIRAFTYLHFLQKHRQEKKKKKKKERGITESNVNVIQEFTNATLSRPKILLLNQNVNVLIKTDVI